MESVLSLDSAARLALIGELGGKPFRAKQLSEWLFVRGAPSWDGMSNLPRPLRDALAARLLDPAATLSVIETAGRPGGTRKLLSRMADGETIETVVIPAGDRATACVSSQVGCAMRCAFCASGRSGCVRSLSSGEIVAQVLAAARLIGRRPDNIVFMGIGEPFNNYDAAIAAARAMNAAAPDGLGIGARHITFSTCGVVPGIGRFADEGMQFELSVSLHAPNDGLRSRLMPVNRRWPLSELIPACRAYTEKTGRLITFEYTLVDGFNAGPAEARELVSLVRGFPCRFNLIPLNPVDGFDGRAPSPECCEAFRAFLERSGYNATLRRSRGRGVNGSCGQLRASAGANAAPSPGQIRSSADARATSPG